VVRDADGRTTTGQLAEDRVFALENVQLTAKRATTNIGVIHDPDHAEPGIIALSATPGYLKTLDYSARWAIELRFSDFKSGGFGVEDSQIQHPDRLARLLLRVALALDIAVSTGQGDAETNPASAEKKTSSTSPKKWRVQRHRCFPEVYAISPASSATPCCFRPSAQHKLMDGEGPTTGRTPPVRPAARHPPGRTCGRTCRPRRSPWRSAGH
jgi:hypothetical protein